jgi:hypothetical protein
MTSMPFNVKFLIGILTVFFLTGSCNNGDKTNPSAAVTGSKQGVGAFKITLDTNGVASMLGLINDGPTPSNTIWEKSAVEGNCTLFVPRIPFCPDPCAENAVCVEDSKCQPLPNSMNVGVVTVSGAKTSDGQKTLTMEAISNYYQLIGIKLASPPFGEGDSVSLSAGGDSIAAPFTMGVRGISPLKLLNDSLVLADGQPINLKWTPPGIAGISTISVSMDISYHGGTKGKIETVCEDNGSLTIPAGLIGKLKALGISGFPKIEIARQSIGSNSTGKVKFIIVSEILTYLIIPGVISCDGNGDCPKGHTCGSDKRCN